MQNDSLATLLARLEGILGPLPSWMVSQGRYSNRYYTRSRQLYERSKVSGRYGRDQGSHLAVPQCWLGWCIETQQLLVWVGLLRETSASCSAGRCRLAVPGALAFLPWFTHSSCCWVCCGTHW